MSTLTKRMAELEALETEIRTIAQQVFGNVSQFAIDDVRRLALLAREHLDKGELIVPPRMRMVPPRWEN